MPMAMSSFFTPPLFRPPQDHCSKVIQGILAMEEGRTMVKQVRRFLSSLSSLFLDKADQRNLTALGHAVTWGQVSWAEGAIMFVKSLDCTNVSSDSLT